MKYLIVCFSLLTFLIALGTFLLKTYRWTDPQIVLKTHFEPFEIRIPEYELYDLGVADINNDPLLDVYSVNHSAQQAILVNDGDSMFNDMISELGLSQDYTIPYLENSNTHPVISTPGIYIYRYNKNLIIKSVQIDVDFNGNIELPWPIKILSSKKATTKLGKSSQHNVPNGKIDFSIKSDGEVILVGEDNILELEHKITIDAEFDHSKVFLGRSLTQPAHKTHLLSWRDRHSMVWTDVNNDGKTDVYIGRGGVKGKIGQLPIPVNDELFIGKDGNFENEISTFGLSKGNCPSRQSALVDIDGDNQLDIYLSCGRNKILEFANHLFMRNESGTFDKSPNARGLDYNGISVFKWLDSDNDSDLDLLAMEGPTLAHYKNDDGVFSRTEISSDNTETYVQIVSVDIDNDNDFDAIALSRTQNRLLINNNGQFIQKPTSSAGLPAGSRSMALVDFNNDGRIDIHAVPGGIFQQTSPGEFTKTGILDENLSVDRITQARCNWFDIENDGKVDVVCGIQKFPVTELRWWKKIWSKIKNTRYWETISYRNITAGGHWIQIDLEGTEGNKEAIGASVELVTNSGNQLLSVGQFDTAHYSQGHYRLYAGLGVEDMILALTVNWPNGDVTNLFDIEANQLINIKQDL